MISANRVLFLLAQNLNTFIQTLDSVLSIGKITLNAATELRELQQPEKKWSFSIFTVYYQSFPFSFQVITDITSLFYVFKNSS